MKKILLTGIALLALTAMLSAMIPRAAALPDSFVSMNARFIRWQQQPHVIHIGVYNDEGTPRSGVPAEVAVGQPILFGFEWGDSSVEQLQAAYIDNPDHDIRVSVDGGPPVYIKDRYQSPFDAVSGAGPRWTWDHDGDGRGDRDGDGIGDWIGPTLFFRYQSPGLPAGEHTFTFEVVDDGVNWYPLDTITVIAG